MDPKLSNAAMAAAMMLAEPVQVGADPMMVPPRSDPMWGPYQPKGRIRRDTEQRQKAKKIAVEKRRAKNKAAKQARKKNRK